MSTAKNFIKQCYTIPSLMYIPSLFREHFDKEGTENKLSNF